MNAPDCHNMKSLVIYHKSIIKAHDYKNTRVLSFKFVA